MSLFECKICFHKVLTESGLVTHLRKKHSCRYADYRNQFKIKTEYEILLENGGIPHQKARWIDVETEQSKTRERQSRHVQELSLLGLEDLICKICGFSSKSNLITHVTKKHNIKVEDYYTRFPGSKLYRHIPSVAKSTGEKLRQRHKNDQEFHKKIVSALPPLPSKIEFWTSRGFTEEEANSLRSIRQRETALLGGEEKLQKMRRASSGDRNPMSLVSIARRHNVSETEASMLTPCYGRTRELHPMWGKNHTPESLEKIANAPHLKSPSWRSTHEVEISNWCKQQFQCDILENEKMGRWNVDILLDSKKLIIEYFGCWWHANPRFYDDNWVHPFTRKSAKEIRERDFRKFEYLKSLGYNVIVVWESDWKENSEREKERIINAYNRTL